MTSNDITNINDSRIFGLVPENHIIGKASLIWFSKERNTGLFEGYRWNRFFSKSKIMEEIIYLTSAYLAPVQYYAKLFTYKNVFIEQHDNYVKQTYRNRCTIATADGKLDLSIPTEKSNSLKCPMKDIRISDHGKWRHLHWTAIESAYKNSPFFDYYQDDFRPFYEKKYPFLFDFNQELCSLICNLIDIHPDIYFTKEYKQEFQATELDYREVIHPKKGYAFDKTFTPQPYYQVFDSRHGFQPNLSIIDLLFNMGPESILVLRNSHSQLVK